jgi:hypothetical protein
MNPRVGRLQFFFVGFSDPQVAIADGLVVLQFERKFLRLEWPSEKIGSSRRP